MECHSPSRQLASVDQWTSSSCTAPGRLPCVMWSCAHHNVATCSVCVTDDPSAAQEISSSSMSDVTLPGSSYRSVDIKNFPDSEAQHVPHPPQFPPGAPPRT